MFYNSAIPSPVNKMPERNKVDYLHTKPYQTIPNYKLSITNCHLQIATYKLPLTNYQLQMANYKLPFTSYQLQIAN